MKKIITSKIHGKWMNYPHYNIPAIDYNNSLLFMVYDNDCYKFILTDDSYKIIELSYSINKNIKNIKKEFENSKIVEITQDYCIISNVELFENFPPNDCLKDRVIFTIWFGTIYTDNRDKQFQSIVKNSGCKVININENNIHLLDHPLHKSFTYLSSIHKADYLRCYLMYHYGGGYSDLKGTEGSWVHCFETLENNENLYAIGYRCDGIPSKKDSGQGYSVELSKKLIKNKNNIIGVGFFIFKKNNSLIDEWFLKLNEKLDFFYDKLKENPAKYDRETACGCPGPVWEKEATLSTNYPIHWNTILGYILYPIYLNHIKHIKLGIPNRTDNGNYK